MVQKKKVPIDRARLRLGFATYYLIYNSCLFPSLRRNPMPRRSSRELEMEGLAAGIAAGMNYGRPEPPAGMSEAAAKIWRDAVSSMKEMHFSRETHALLTRYCNAMVECERLEAELAGIEPKSIRYDPISKRLTATASVALAYARALRLTPKSSLEGKRGQVRDPHRTLRPKLWERSSASETKKPWDM
jgi:phage terminase small subunit